MTGVGSGGKQSDDDALERGSLSSSSRRFEGIAPAVLDALPEIVYVLDADGRLVDWNERLETVTGFDEMALDRKPAVSLVADSDSKTFSECFASVLENGETVSRDVSLVVDDGDVVPHRLTVGPIVEDGETVGVTGTAHDISEQLARERAFEEKNARLERFASIVSHDLRNPLAVADGYLELAKQESDAPYLDEIDAAHDRMNQLIDDVLALARTGAELDETHTVDLTGVATDAWGVVATGDASIRVTDLGTVEGDRSRLRQLFENLFCNSVEHGSTSNRSAQRSGDSVEHGSTGSQDGRSRPDDAIEHGGADVAVTVDTTESGFYVADDGPGIPEAAGDPFEDGVTTKEEGTGLGLSIVESVAAAHGWTVAVSDAENGGARFDVRF